MMAEVGSSDWGLSCEYYFDAIRWTEQQHPPQTSKIMCTCVFTHLHGPFTAVVGFREGTDLHQCRKRLLSLSHLLTIMLHRFFQQTFLGCEYNFPFILLPNFFLPQYTFPFPFHFTLNLLITVPIELYRGIRWFTC